MSNLHTKHRTTSSKILAGALLAASLAFLPFKASTEELSNNTPKSSLSLRLGAGADFKDKSQSRPIVGVAVGVPANKAKIELGIGLSTKESILGNSPSSMGLEDLSLNVGMPVYGKLGFDVYAYNSRHLGVGLATGADLHATVGSVTAIVGAEKNSDGPLPVFAIARIEAIEKTLVLMPQVIWVSNKDVIGGRFRGSLKSSDGLPEIYLDVLVLGGLRDHGIVASTISVGIRATLH